ncbi:MAG TPA: hypothetical protein VF449_05235 [Parvibaculum sp.]
MNGHADQKDRACRKSLKWWEARDLSTSGDTFFPTSLRENLPDILAGRYPDGVLHIEP